MVSRRVLLTVVVVVAVAVVGFIIVVPIIPFQYTNCSGGISCITAVGVKGLESVSRFLFGYGGKTVDGTYHFG